MCEFWAGSEHFVVKIKYMGFIFEETPMQTPIGSASGNRTLLAAWRNLIYQQIKNEVFIGGPSVVAGTGTICPIAHSSTLFRPLFNCSRLPTYLIHFDFLLQVVVRVCRY